MQNIFRRKGRANPFRAFFQIDSVAMKELLVDFPWFPFHTQMLFRAVMRWDEERKALGKTATFLQFFYADMAGIIP